MLGQMSAEPKMKGNVGYGSASGEPVAPYIAYKTSLEVPGPYHLSRKVSSTSSPPTTCISKAR